jgi:hypothetical protein
VREREREDGIDKKKLVSKSEWVDRKEELLKTETPESNLHFVFKWRSSCKKKMFAKYLFGISMKYSFPSVFADSIPLLNVQMWISNRFLGIR